MRLIDADALIEQMESDMDQMEMVEFKLGAIGAIHDIKHAPTVDAEPVRYGKWEYSEDDFETAVCSNCGWDSEEAMLPVTNWFNYCPYCGAKMYGESK